jgi:hypothetical protein
VSEKEREKARDRDYGGTGVVHNKTKDDNGKVSSMNDKK